MRRGPTTDTRKPAVTAGVVAALRECGARVVERVHLGARSRGGGGVAAFAGTPCAREVATPSGAGGETSVETRPAPGGTGLEGS